MARHGRRWPARPHVLLRRAVDGLSCRRSRSGRDEPRRRRRGSPHPRRLRRQAPRSPNSAACARRYRRNSRTCRPRASSFSRRCTFVSPAASCVAIAQDRVAEKRFIAEVGRAGRAACGDRIDGSARRAARREDRRRAAGHSEDRAARLRRQGTGERAQRRGRAPRACVAVGRAVRARKAHAAQVRSVRADRARRRRQIGRVSARAERARQRHSREDGRARARCVRCARRAGAGRGAAPLPRSSAMSACCASNSSCWKTAR